MPIFMKNISLSFLFLVISFSGASFTEGVGKYFSVFCFLYELLENWFCFFLKCLVESALEPAEPRVFSLGTNWFTRCMAIYTVYFFWGDFW